MDFKYFTLINPILRGYIYVKWDFMVIESHMELNSGFD